MVLAGLDDHYTQRVDFGASVVWRKLVVDRNAAWQTEICLQYSEFLADAFAPVFGLCDGEKAGDV